MLRDPHGVRTRLLRYGRDVLAVVTIAALASACGIKGPLKPAPAAAPVQPATTPAPAPNAPAPAQEPPPPVSPRP